MVFYFRLTQHNVVDNSPKLNGCLFLLINSVQNIVVDNKSQLTDTQIT